ncbi:HAD family hydrolase, partial [Streptomyces mirabilis]|uniref:HAD family hydrolase n=1 Tax=Streptomyces mirabilis TaxID=68239 RepID=UPI0033FCF316
MADVIFFDLDGTLVDHRSAVWETIGQIIQAAPNATAPPEELATLWLRGLAFPGQASAVDFTRRFATSDVRRELRAGV